MSDFREALTAKEKARFVEAARLGALWFLHNQNTPAQAWGGVDQSADIGRFLYEYFPTTGYCRGTGVWSQALAISSLLAVSKVPRMEGSTFREAALLGGSYLKSLQWLDARNPQALGGFREHNPQDEWSFPRDGATGCFGLAVLARETGEQEYLDRANLFCQWYRSNGSDRTGWPYDFYNFAERKGSCQVPGDWQAGGALAYYYTARAAKDDRWIKEGFKPVAERLLDLGDPKTVDGVAEGWHGESRITVGNDDFATVALLAAFLTFEDERYLDVARKRLAWMMSLQDADGSFPNNGGTCVTALTLLEFIEIAAAKRLPDQTGRMVEALLKAGRCALTLQETTSRDRRAYGGLYGQSNYGVGRDRLHNRDTNYGIHLFLRLAGHAAPCLSALAWA
jgi:hypothetical protein